VKALAQQLMAQKRRCASALASCAAMLHAYLMAQPVVSGIAGLSSKRLESRSVIGNGVFGFNWNTGITSSGGNPQVAGG